MIKNKVAATNELHIRKTEAQATCNSSKRHCCQVWNGWVTLLIFGIERFGQDGLLTYRRQKRNLQELEFANSCQFMRMKMGNHYDPETKCFLLEYHHKVSPVEKDSKLGHSRTWQLRAPYCRHSKL